MLNPCCPNLSIQLSHPNPEWWETTGKPFIPCAKSSDASLGPTPQLRLLDRSDSAAPGGPLGKRENHEVENHGYWTDAYLSVACMSVIGSSFQCHFCSSTWLRFCCSAKHRNSGLCLHFEVLTLRSCRTNWIQLRRSADSGQESAALHRRAATTRRAEGSPWSSEEASVLSC